jgi:predicted negative regulator of RcsB-dependent stress response
MKKTIIIVVISIIAVLVVGFQQWQIIKLNQRVSAKLDKVIEVDIQGKKNPLDLATFNKWMLSKILEAQPSQPTN